MSAADDVVLPALLRGARGAYGASIRRQLAAAGYDDLPRNGAYVLGGIVNHGGAAGELMRQLGISKQAASQLVDTLVLRGYLQRDPDPSDGRRMVIVATERGRAAGAAIRSGVAEVDDRLRSMVSAYDVAALRSGLFALCEISDQFKDELRGR